MTHYGRFFLAATAVFGLGIAAGLLTPPDVARSQVASLGGLAQQLTSLPPLGLFVYILFRNASVLFFSFILSPFLLLTPLLALGFNGWLIGAVGIALAQSKSVAYVLAGTLPHAIFEIPAFIIAEAAALSFGLSVLVALFRKERRPALSASLSTSLKYLAAGLVLLVPAAAVEALITPRVLAYFGG